MLIVAGLIGFGAIKGCGKIAKDIEKRNEAARIAEKKRRAALSPEERAKEDRQNKIRALFSQLDGRHYGLTIVVKKNMNDPDSFEHVKTVYADKGTYLLVTMMFRGKNAFGAKVINTVSAKVDLDGSVLMLLQDE